MGSLATPTPLLSQQAALEELNKSMPSTADSERAMTPSELVRMRFVDEETEVPAEIFDAMLKLGKAAKQRFAHDRVHSRLGPVLVRTASLLTDEFCQSTDKPKPTCPSPPQVPRQPQEGGPEAFLHTPLDVIQWEDDPFGVLFESQVPPKTEETPTRVQANAGDKAARPQLPCKISPKHLHDKPHESFPTMPVVWEQVPFRVLLEEGALTTEVSRKQVPGKFLKPCRKQKTHRERAAWSLMLQNW